jgi:hypothetical protein
VVDRMVVYTKRNEPGGSNSPIDRSGEVEEACVVTVLRFIITRGAHSTDLTMNRNLVAPLICHAYVVTKAKLPK